MQRPTVSIAPSNWKFQTIKVFTKSLRELPVGIDLPRLARYLALEDPSGPMERLETFSELMRATEDYTSVVDQEIALADGKMFSNMSCKKGDLFCVLERNIEHQGKRRKSDHFSIFFTFQ